MLAVDLNIIAIGDPRGRLPSEHLLSNQIQIRRIAAVLQCCVRQLMEQTA